MENIKNRNNRYELINDCANDNRNLERSYSSNESAEDLNPLKTSAKVAVNYHNCNVTDSDIINQNVVTAVDDNELNCSSLDTIKVNLLLSELDKLIFCNNHSSFRKSLIMRHFCVIFIHLYHNFRDIIITRKI